jgi:hypothetical protein
MKEWTRIFLAICFVGLAAPVIAKDDTVPVNLRNFARAETDRYFAAAVAQGNLGQFHHDRKVVPIENQIVIRSNRDTLYSSAVFDLTAPATIEMPNTEGRFQSFLVINQDHYVKGIDYGPGVLKLTKEAVGSRYVVVIVRTLVNPDDPGDIAAAHAAQDAITVRQSDQGALELPNWNRKMLDTVRQKLIELAPFEPDTKGRFGDRSDVDPVNHLVGTAAAWGGNPPEAAAYFPVYPENASADGSYTLTLRDVPVDGFWSVSVYNAKGFFQKNPHASYSVNNVTAKAEADGAVVVRFGGNPRLPNYLHLPGNGWNYILRLYRPRNEVLNGSWMPPALKPINP